MAKADDTTVNSTSSNGVRPVAPPMAMDDDVDSELANAPPATRYVVNQSSVVSAMKRPTPAFARRPQGKQIVQPVYEAVKPVEAPVQSASATLGAIALALQSGYVAEQQNQAAAAAYAPPRLVEGDYETEVPYVRPESVPSFESVKNGFLNVAIKVVDLLTLFYDNSDGTYRGDFVLSSGLKIVEVADLYKAFKDILAFPERLESGEYFNNSRRKKHDRLKFLAEQRECRLKFLTDNKINLNDLEAVQNFMSQHKEVPRTKIFNARIGSNAASESGSNGSNPSRTSTVPSRAFEHSQSADVGKDEDSVSVYREVINRQILDKTITSDALIGVNKLPNGTYPKTYPSRGCVVVARMIAECFGAPTIAIDPEVIVNLRNTNLGLQ